MIKKTILLLTTLFLFFTSFASASIITYDYDSRNRLERAIYADGTTIEYTYDNIGNRLSTVITNPDTDADGMPDIWEMLYFNTLDRDGTGDYDGDGISDLDEYLNGTNPAQDTQPPTVTVTPMGGVYNSAQTVTLSMNEPGDIYYTLDGTDPTPGSTLYEAPIQITETLTLKALAVDTAGNPSAIIEETYTIQLAINVTVTTSTGRLLENIHVYAFTAANVYTGLQALTNAQGIAAFNVSDFTNGDYVFRADYLADQFWSDTLTVPGDYTTQVLIQEETTEITVTVAGEVVAGVRVYLFNENGTYLGVYATTDADGRVTFTLPVGQSYMFRADYMGSQYWSEPETIHPGGPNLVGLDAGGGRFEITLQEGPQEPISDIRIYLFNQAGSYLGQYQTSDADGIAAFDVPEATYMVRADYLGYQFWSDPILVSTDTHIDLTLPHQDVTITLSGAFQSSTTPIEAMRIYLFTPSGSYLGHYQTTDGNGQVVFHLPERAYKVRADYLGAQFWSEDFVWTNTPISVPMADALITVTGGGFPREGENVYVFSASGSYLGLHDTTDANGQVTFRLAEGPYTFRADHQGSQFWSGSVSLTAHEVNPVEISTGGGTFTVTVETQAPEPLAGLRCYVFNDQGSYLGLYGSTDTNGEVAFDLADGVYQFRADYLGYEFWSDIITIPDVMSSQVLVEQEAVEVTVNTSYGPVPGVRAYLFSEAGAYLGQYQETDTNGIVMFDLPVGKGYQFRADILNNQYWSAPVTIQPDGINDVTINAGGGTLQVTVEQEAGVPMPGLDLYLFNENGQYLGLHSITDAQGMALFDVPEGTYKARADYLGYSFWTGPISVATDTPITLSIPHQPVAITVSGMFLGVTTPLEGLSVYLFSPTDAYLGQYVITDINGQAVFDLPEMAYKARVDYMGNQFWSDVFTWADTPIDIPMADAEVTVSGAGLPQAGVPVYAFTSSNTYLGLNQATDANGSVTFRLPADTYAFRADYQGSPFWSGDAVLLADQANPVIISVGGGTFTFLLEKAAAEPLAGVKCYVFNAEDTYLGLLGSTDEDGLVRFDLADGSYKIRADYLGYSFWSPVFDVPASLSGVLTLSHTDVTITVQGDYFGPDPVENVKTYLFNAAGSYLGLNKTTDTAGQVVYSVPDQEYRVRADYLGEQYWSAPFQQQDKTITISQGLVRVHVSRGGTDVSGARVYLFTPSGAYLGRYVTTDALGEVEYIIPVGSYLFRVDEGGTQQWSGVIEVQAGVEINVEVSLD
jgi:hypothetical protein